MGQIIELPAGELHARLSPAATLQTAAAELIKATILEIEGKPGNPVEAAFMNLDEAFRIYMNGGAADANPPPPFADYKSELDLVRERRQLERQRIVELSQKLIAEELARFDAETARAIDEALPF